jgi:hypothetical protein
MRRIENTGQFRRDYKREAKGLYRATLDAELVPVLAALARDESLEPRHRDTATPRPCLDRGVEGSPRLPLDILPALKDGDSYRA